MSSPEFQVLYGGAAGGGKSYALLAEAMRYAQYGDYRALIVRKTLNDLRELVQKGKELYQAAFPGTQYNKQDKVFTFPSGATIWLNYVDSDDDVETYQGQAFAFIAFDELTQWPTAYAWNYLTSRCRTTNPNITPTMRATTNPGGVGHGWVKKMFIDPAPEGKSFWARDLETGEILVDDEEYDENGFPNPDYNKPIFKRKFIAAKLKDNPYLAKGKQYRRALLSLPEHQRKQLLEGSWDIVEGAAFTEFNRQLHTCEPFFIPNNWRKFRAADYGYGSYSAVLWFAVAPSGTIYIYREMYVTQTLARTIAEDIHEIETENDEKVQYGVLDSSCWNTLGVEGKRNRGKTIAEDLTYGRVKWRPSDRGKGSRKFGKQLIHSHLAIDEITEVPGLIIFDTCTNLISQLPVLQLDKKDPDDVNTKSEDHLYDALRYGLLSRPKSKSIMDFTDTKMKDYTSRPFCETFGY